MGYFCPNWPGTKFPEGIYSQDEVRQPCLYFKCSEGVFFWLTWSREAKFHDSYLLKNISELMMANPHNSLSVQRMHLCTDNELCGLTHWGRMAHIYATKYNIIGSDNRLSPGRHQVIIWTNDRMLLIWLSGSNFDEMFIEIHILLFKKIHLKMSSAKWWPFCLGLNVLIIKSRWFRRSLCSAMWSWLFVLFDEIP